MSRAFVDDDSERPDELPEIPQSPHPGYITPQGLAMLRDELERLEQVERPPLAAAVADGGSNATPAEIAMARIDQRANYLRARIARAIVVDPATASHDRVHFGASVLTEDATGHRMTVHIVGEDETDLEAGRVSWISPIARALISRRVGETAIWKRPIGDIELKILAIDPVTHPS